MSELALRQCLLEVVEGTVQGQRPIPDGKFKADFATGSDLYNQAASALIRPTFNIDVNYAKSKDQVQQPSVTQIEDIEIKIITTYLLKNSALSADSYMRIKCTSAEDGILIRDSFKFPGKLLTNDAGESTGIINGCLGWVSSNVTKDQAPLGSADPGLYITEHIFAGWIKRTITA